MKKVFFAVALILVFISASGCINESGQNSIAPSQNSAAEKCVALCNIALQNGNDLSAGPCLSNKIIDDWACDVAHNPRAQVDNEPANQCPEFGKSAHHFVEVSPECEPIKTQ